MDADPVIEMLGRPLRLAVIGAGAAGTAAAWYAARQGARVTVLSARAGSSSLSSGALDFDYDEAGVGPELAPEVSEFAAALGVWRLNGKR